MQQQTGLFFYKFRFLFAATLTVAFLMLISVLVTAIGSNSVLAHPSTKTLSMDTYDNPNVVTAGANALANGAQNAMLSTGSALYRTCRSITTVTARSGKSIVHGSAVIASSTWDGAWHGAACVARGVG